MNNPIISFPMLMKVFFITKNYFLIKQNLTVHYKELVECKSTQLPAPWSQG